MIEFSVEASRTANRKYYLLHKDKITERSNNYRRLNREHVNALARKRRALDPEKDRIRHREYHKLNREKERIRHKKYRTENKEKIHQRHLKRMVTDVKYKNRRIAISRKCNTGWATNEFEAAWEAQKGLCSICKRKLSKTGRSINSVCADHNHKTKKIRGLLCIKCNLLIGNARENIDTLKNAIKYLRKHS